MQYIEAPSDEEPKFVSVFLAGGITNCPDWQSLLVRKLGTSTPLITVYNPRRENFPIGDKEAGAVQITWEYKRLHAADLISFWFSRGSLNPIVLFELGAALERDQDVVVGIDPAYERRFDVEFQTHLRRPEVPVVYDLDELADEILYDLGWLTVKRKVKG